MNREQFFDRLAGLDRQQTNKVLWTLYWRGSAQLRERVETELDTVEHGGRRKPAAPPPVDATAVRAEVDEFVMLARAGAYLAGDRRVSPRERSRWRFTFRRLAGDAQRALRESDAADARAALEKLINLAHEVERYDYFRSQDPVEAARFVVSDAVALLWATRREREGFAEFARTASAQLVQWESSYGWTRSGFGTVSQKEISLARVLVDMLRIPDAWVGFADAYLDALDGAVRGRQGGARNRRQRTEDLAEWHLLLLDKLVDTDDEGRRLDRLTQHPALGGPEVQHLQARLAHRRGDLAGARDLMERALSSLPGHGEYLRFALEIDADLPPRARQVAEERQIAGPLG